LAVGDVQIFELANSSVINTEANVEINQLLLIPNTAQSQIFICNLNQSLTIQSKLGTYTKKVVKLLALPLFCYIQELNLEDLNSTINCFEVLIFWGKAPTSIYNGPLAIAVINQIGNSGLYFFAEAFIN